MPELSMVPDPALWALYGIMYLSGPKTFQALKEEFSLPNHLLFRYLQLRHAVQAQFTNRAITLDTPLSLTPFWGQTHPNLYLTSTTPLDSKRQM